MFNWLKSKISSENHPDAAARNSIGGYISQFGLENWWLSEFSPDEREIISDTYRPMGSSGRPLIEGTLLGEPHTDQASFLANLATWLAKPNCSDLAFRIANKAWTVRHSQMDKVQAHFTYMNLCKVFYRFRETQPDALEKAISACEESVSLAPQLDASTIGGGSPVSHYC